MFPKNGDIFAPTKLLENGAVGAEIWLKASLIDHMDSLSPFAKCDSIQGFLPAE